MRRRDRQITDIYKISQIMEKCQVTRIAFNHENGPYILPLNFGFYEHNSKFTLYFHGAKEGRKAILISQNPCVGFEMDTNGKLEENDTACGHSYFYQSIIGTGKVSPIEYINDKKHALKLIMKHATGKDNWDFPNSILSRTGVFKLEVTELSAKEHL